jgi:cell division septum initiation protein DivIVA
VDEIKKGFYDKTKTDAFIASLRADYEASLAAQKERIFSQVEELEKLKAELVHYKKREDYIGRAIVSALQKADQIETAARQKYETELHKLQSFYAKFSDYFAHVKTFYPLDKELTKVNRFVGQMDDVLEQKSAALRTDAAAPEAQTLRAYEQERKRLQKNGWQIKPIEEQINNIAVSGKDEEVFKKYTVGANDIAANLLTGTDKNAPAAKMLTGADAPAAKNKQYLDREAPPEPVAAAIDLDAILRPTQTLEDLCAELGLLADGKKKKK